MSTADNRTYVGPYKVYKQYRKSRRRKVLCRNLTREQAMQMVNRFPSSNRSMVVFDKQFYADKYYKTLIKK